MDQRETKHGSALLLICGIVNLLGGASVIIADVVGILLVERHNPISETMSALARGRFAWIQDLGFVLFAAALAATGIGILAWKLGVIRWRIGALLLGLLAIDMVLIAIYNQHAGEETTGGTIHTYCVYALYLMFAAVPLLVAVELRPAHMFYWLASLGSAIAWIILGPLFMFVVPTSWDGAIERLMGLIMTGWIAMLGGLLLQRGRGRVADL